MKEQSVNTFKQPLTFYTVFLFILNYKSERFYSLF